MIIAEDVDGEALATLVVNKLRGTLNVARRQGPGLRRPPQGDAARHRHPDRRPGHLRGDRPQARQRRRSRTSAAPAASSSTKDDTTFVEGHGDEAAIKGRVEQIRAQIETTTSDFDREKLQERLAKLAGGVAVIKVGAATETELKEKKHRVEDALSATRAAVEEGIVPGGGVALINAIAALDGVKAEGDVKTGVNILRRALEEPMRGIAEQRRRGRRGRHRRRSAARRPSRRTPTSATTCSPTSTSTCSRPGIIDPAKVTRSAVENAASIAGMILTTEALITDKPEKRRRRRCRRAAWAAWTTRPAIVERTSAGGAPHPRWSVSVVAACVDQRTHHQVGRGSG